jgi:hypothetical protein
MAVPVRTPPRRVNGSLRLTVRGVIAGHSASEDARERAYNPAIHLLRANSYEEGWTTRNRVYPISGVLGAQVG